MNRPGDVTEEEAAEGVRQTNQAAWNPARRGFPVTGLPLRPSHLIARPPSPRFLAAAGAVLALVLTLFSAFESTTAHEIGGLWQHFATRLVIDYASLAVVVLVVAASKRTLPVRLFAEPHATRAVLLSFAPYTVGGIVGGVARYYLRVGAGVSWQVEYPWELWTNIGAGILAFTMVGFIASQYYPLLERLERLRDLGVMTEQAAAIASGRDFQRRLDLSDRSDEVGQLARTINHLLATVQATLESHRDFLADTSHELRNPLLALRMNLEVMERVGDSKEREECLREAKEQSERMSRMVADLLTLARLEAGQILERKPVALRSVLTDTVREGHRQASGKVLSLEVAADVTVDGDAGRLRQIFSNLVENSVRHTPAGGSITIRLWSAGGYACVEVADTGEGIPAEHLPHVFERFYRVGKANGDGVGLGLAIAKHLCEAHGGRITVTSQPSRGTCFNVLLPASSCNPHQ